LESTLEAARQARNGSQTGEPLPRYLVERLLLDIGGYIEGHSLGAGDEAVRDEIRAARRRLAEAGAPVPAVEAMARYGWVARVLDGVITRPDEAPVTLGDRVDALLTHRFWGTAVLALLMLVIFHAVFAWAEIPMNAIDSAVGWL